MNGIRTPELESECHVASVQRANSASKKEKWDAYSSPAASAAPSIEPSRM